MWGLEVIRARGSQERLQQDNNMISFGDCPMGRKGSQQTDPAAPSRTYVVWTNVAATGIQ